VAARLRPERMLYQGASEGRAVQVEIRPPLSKRNDWRVCLSDTVAMGEGGSASVGLTSSRTWLPTQWPPPSNYRSISHHIKHETVVPSASLPISKELLWTHHYITRRPSWQSRSGYERAADGQEDRSVPTNAHHFQYSSRRRRGKNRSPWYLMTDLTL
jgi:hypothetical protein